MFHRNPVHLTVALSEMEFRKDTGTLTLCINMRNTARFPDQLSVVSEHTGRIVKFVQDHQAAEENEYWDGELMKYIPTEYLPKVDHLVVFPYF